jgi:hypothetical protein
LYGKHANTSVNHLQINIGELKKMGCNYILSAVRINNSGDLKINLLKKFTDADSYWDIYLYAL